MTVDANKDFQINLKTNNIMAPPIHIIIISFKDTANISPNNNPITSNLINDKKPMTTRPIAKEECAKSPNNASPGRLVFFWRLTSSKAIMAEITKTDIAIFNSKEYAIVTPNRAEWAKVSPK